MIEVSGNFYDAGASRSFPARVALLDNAQVHVSGEGFVREHLLDEIRVSARLGDLVRTFNFPDGSLFESDDNDEIDRYLESAGQNRLSRRVHMLESSWRWVAPALLVAIVAAWGFVVYGLPALASGVAYSLPPEVDDQLGRDGMTLMDKWFFDPSQLSPDRQNELREKFDSLAGHADIGRQLTVEFRSGGDIGANAFALPSAMIVMTDELVELAENDNELIAVLAHEIGHVAGRHSLRLLLQDSIVALMFAVVLGDVTSVTGLAGAIPTVLVQTRFSRGFETEADSYALELMEETGIAPHYFSDILRRLEGHHDDGDFPDFLSSHPATDQRVRRFED